MKNMKFYGYHGVLPEEQAAGQNFIIDTELFVDLSKASATDDLEDTVNYGEVYSVIADITKNCKFRLIEKLADSIAREILSRYKKVAEITVTVKKPQAPIDGEFDWMGVKIGRSRNEL